MSKLLERSADLATIGAAVSAVILAGIALSGASVTRTAPSTSVPLGEVAEWEQYTRDGHRLGPADASITIVEFGDYQCPFCKVTEPHIKEILREYPDEVALVFRHLPLAGHTLAYPAARAAECAADQGAFWPFHNLLFADAHWQQGEVTPVFLQFAMEAKVADISAFEECIGRETPVGEIATDMAAASQLAFTGTPSFLINGQRHVGVLDLNRFEMIYQSITR